MKIVKLNHHQSNSIVPQFFRIFLSCLMLDKIFFESILSIFIIVTDTPFSIVRNIENSEKDKICLEIFSDVTSQRYSQIIQTVLDIGEKKCKSSWRNSNNLRASSDIFIKTERYMWLLSTLAASWPKRIFLFNIGIIFRVTFHCTFPQKYTKTRIIQKFLFYLSRGTVKNKIIIIIIIVKYR